MVVSDDEDNRELSSVDGDDDVDGQGCVDEVIIVEKSAGGDSTGSILLLPERNEDNTVCLSHVNYPWMSEAHEMPTEGMSRTVVQTNLTETGFGVSEIYERVPNEDEDFLV